MNKVIDARTLVVSGAIRAAISTSAEPGLSVNQHPNPFFLNVIGALDLRRIAETVLQRLDQYTEDKAKEAPSVPVPVPVDGA